MADGARKEMRISFFGDPLVCVGLCPREGSRAGRSLSIRLIVVLGKRMWVCEL